MQDSGRHAFLKNSVTIPKDRKPQRGSSMGDICFYGLNGKPRQRLRSTMKISVAPICRLKKLKETLVLCTHL